MNFRRLIFPVLVFATVFGVGSASAVCTNASLVGVWGYQVGSSAGQFTADGHGNITAGSQTVSYNGSIVTQTLTGSYSVAANCTGSLTLNLTGVIGGPWTANFVLDQQSKGARIIDTTIGVASDGVGLAQGVVTCGLTGAKKTFAASFLGKIPTSSVAYLAQVVLDGKGKVSGNGTFAINGAMVPASLSGTYTENVNCTGSLQFTPSGFPSAMNFNFVVVNGGKEILLVETDAGTVVAGNMQQ